MKQKTVLTNEQNHPLPENSEKTPLFLNDCYIWRTKLVNLYNYHEIRFGSVKDTKDSVLVGYSVITGFGRPLLLDKIGSKN